jgi:hypothetical protein
MVFYCVRVQELNLRGLADNTFPCTGKSLVDLYDATDTSIAEGIGTWDIMADPYGHKDDGVPGFLSAWSRDLVKWVNVEDITYDGIYVLKPAATSLQSYRISVNEFSPYPEYLLIENRQQISFDETLSGNGIVIYHIDDAADGMKNRGYPGQEGWPENGNHYSVAVLPKDGAYDLEQKVNAGDAGDMWLPGDVLGPGMGSTVFPNTDSVSQFQISICLALFLSGGCLIQLFVVTW